MSNPFSSKLLIRLSLAFLLISCGCSESSTDDSESIPNYTDEQLLDRVQRDALKYFWDFAHPNCKLARERYHEDAPFFDANTVTIGGSGFGLMTILVAIERGFVGRAEGVSRIQTALNFLESADRFHGAWSHWVDGNSGNVLPFSTYDDGGDLVETALLCQALICIREYFKNGTPIEQAIATKADDLWKGVEWDWYTRGENVLYWHWSPNYGWQMNMKLEGFDETLITYILGASSPTHPIPTQAYTQGWKRNGTITTNALFYSVPIIVKHNGTNSVGPMFWSHYSFLGLDPRGLSDGTINYELVTRNHARAMYNYCVANPLGWGGYNDKCWGLTASYTRNPDGSTGYAAHQPNHDRGVISPTAAISNIPYTPTESLRFLRFLYEENPDRYIGVAGPYDAFSVHHNWKTPRYLAIDQGTIVPMIENHRTGFLWNLFMNAPDIRQGLQNLGFSSSQHGL